MFDKCHRITSKEMCLFVTCLLMVNNPFSIYFMNKYPCNIYQVLGKVFQGYLKTASKCFRNVMGSQVRRCVCSWMSYLGKPPISILLEYIFMSYLSSAGLGSTRVIFKLHLSFFFKYKGITSRKMCMFLTCLCLANHPFSRNYMNTYSCNIYQLLD